MYRPKYRFFYDQLNTMLLCATSGLGFDDESALHIPVQRCIDTRDGASAMIASGMLRPRTLWRWLSQLSAEIQEYKQCEQVSTYCGRKTGSRALGNLKSRICTRSRVDRRLGGVGATGGGSSFGSSFGGGRRFGERFRPQGVHRGERSGRFRGQRNHGAVTDSVRLVDIHYWVFTLVLEEFEDAALHEFVVKLGVKVGREPVRIGLKTRG
jgi:hypothetical protein